MHSFRLRMRRPGFILFALVSLVSPAALPDGEEAEDGEDEEMDEESLFEGDMVLSGDQLLALQQADLDGHGTIEGVHASEPSGNAIIGAHFRWPGNKVKFEISSRMPENQKTLVRRTLQGLEAKLGSCLTFEESSSGNRIFVKVNERGCWSQVGFQERKQNLNLALGCMHAGIVEHEFLHAVGLYHHQSRSDRDYYVKIHWGNIPEALRHNFKKYSSTVINHFNLPYDFRSLMHYGGNDFGNSRMTIQTIDPTKQSVIGQRTGISPGDVELVKKMYECEKEKRGFGGPEDWKFCKDNKCAKGEGDCDSDSECAAGLTCGKDNCREFEPAALRTADCCTDAKEPEPTECQFTDKDAGCPAWAKEGFCIGQYSPWMDENCGKSCKCSTTYNCQEVGINYQARTGSRVKSGVQSWSKCLSLCVEDANCQHWVWNHKGAGAYAFNCALMAGFGKKATDENTVAGPKTCV